MIAKHTIKIGLNDNLTLNVNIKEEMEAMEFLGMTRMVSGMLYPFMKTAVLNVESQPNVVNEQQFIDGVTRTKTGKINTRSLAAMQKYKIVQQTMTDKNITFVQAYKEVFGKKPTGNRYAIAKKFGIDIGFKSEIKAYPNLKQNLQPIKNYDNSTRQTKTAQKYGAVKTLMQNKDITFGEAFLELYKVKPAGGTYDIAKKYGINTTKKQQVEKTDDNGATKAEQERDFFIQNKDKILAYMKEHNNCSVAEACKALLNYKMKPNDYRFLR